MEEGAIDHTKAEEAEGEFSLYSLFKRGLLTDCILVVPREKKVRVEEEGEEDEEEEEGNSGDFKLHKLVLASYSRYCYKKIIPSDEEEGEGEEGDAVVVPEHQQDEGVLRIEIPPLPDLSATREDLLKCVDVICTFMYTHGDWERAISLNPLFATPSASQEESQCGLLLTLLGLTLALEMPSLAHRLAEYILSTCLNPHTAPAVLLRCSYYTDNNADAKALAEAAEALLLDKFDECIQPRLGNPLRVYELSQLPMAMIGRILTSDKLGLGASSGDEELVLRTCTNVLRQRMDRRHIRVGMEMVKPLSGAVEVKLRVMEGIASGSECVRGDPVPRYEGVVSWGEGEEGRIVEGIVPLLDEAPLGEVWAEVEWKLSSGEVIVDELSKEVFQKPQQEEDEEEEDDGKEVSLPSGAVVRVTLRSEEPVQEPEKDSGESGGDEDVAVEEEGEDDEDSSSPKKEEGVWEKEDFEMVYACVRWSQLPLESLISAAESPLWRPAQDRILELMRKFTTTGQQDLPIGGRPRECQKEGYKRRQEMKEEVEAVSRGSGLTASAEVPVSFSYSSDFDSFGALYWLGTRGHTIPWRNPASKLMEVQVMASSVGRGSVDDIVGRSASVDFRTKNEPSSWVQVDFGRGRTLRLTGYCLRNRNSSAQCLMSWNVMGSNDGDDWVILDEKKMCGSLREPKATSYFPIEKSPESRGAFRVFRLVQSGVNSGNTHNLFLAGIEFYGQAMAGEW